MLEAILKTPAGPLWAFLAQVGMLLGIPICIRDVEKKMEATGASEEVVDAAVKAAVFEDFDAFWHYSHEASGEEANYWELIYELQLFLSSPSWGRAVKVARAILPCNDERVIAACLVAATGARPVRAIAEE
jgi:hypothetical protein